MILSVGITRGGL